MCTAIAFSMNDFCFGRTLDLEGTYGESVVILPRNYPLDFLHGQILEKHHAMIGMAHVAADYPLYYDAVNEKGLCMAGLNFPGFARYQEPSDNKVNVASFEFIPWVLGQCEGVGEVLTLLKDIQITGEAFSSMLPVTPLHWIIADRSACIVVEPLADGISVYDNPVGVLTNSPPFDDQMFMLQNYMHLSPNPPENRFSAAVDLKAYSRGMGAIGLPGDLSSQSRFVRAAFTKLNSVCRQDMIVSQFFHIMDSVAQTSGCCRLKDGNCEITQYTSCCNAGKGIYHYTTYGNRRITGIDMHREDLDSDRLIRFPLLTQEDIQIQNG